jgi:hypothetical protein
MLVFWVVTSCEIRFGDISCVYLQPVWTCDRYQLFRIKILSPSSALKMETVCFSETLISTYTSTRCYYLEDQHRHFHRSKNLKSQTEGSVHTWLGSEKDNRQSFSNYPQEITIRGQSCTQNLKAALGKYGYSTLMSIFPLLLRKCYTDSLSFKKFPDKGRVAFHTKTDALKLTRTRDATSVRCITLR